MALCLYKTAKDSDLIKYISSLFVLRVLKRSAHFPYPISWWSGVSFLLWTLLQHSTTKLVSKAVSAKLKFLRMFTMSGSTAGLNFLLGWSDHQKLLRYSYAFVILLWYWLAVEVYWYLHVFKLHRFHEGSMPIDIYSLRFALGTNIWCPVKCFPWVRIWFPCRTNIWLSAHALMLHYLSLADVRPLSDLQTSIFFFILNALGFSIYCIWM